MSSLLLLRLGSTLIQYLGWTEGLPRIEGGEDAGEEMGGLGLVLAWALREQLKAAVSH